jgi:hypothetical protein
MKRSCILVCLLVISLLPASAESLIGNLIESGLDSATRNHTSSVVLNGETVYLGGISLRSLKGVMQTHDFSALPHEQRITLFDQSKVPVTWPVFKNLLAGFGKGSQLQGDLGSELFGIITDWTTLSAVGVGAGLLLVDFLFIYPFSQLNGGNTGYFETDDALQELALQTMLIGGGAFVAGRVIQSLLPLIYGSRYNSNLRKGLGLSRKMEDTFAFDIGIMPVITDLGAAPTGVQLVARIGM